MNYPIKQQPQRFVKKPQAWFVRGLLLYFLPLLAIPATIIALGKGNVYGIFVNASAYALFLLAAGLLRRGLLNEANYNDKRITRPPRWPLKTYAALLVAFACSYLAWLGAGHSLLVSACYGAGAFLGMYLTYGFDPRSEKTVAGSHGYSTAEIAQAIEEAETKIAAIAQANTAIRNTELNQRIGAICRIAQDIVLQLETDPGDIRRARKFLNVYLDGACNVTEGYAKKHLLNDAGELEQNFRNVLTTIETVFSEQKQKLLEQDTFDLDVQIEVLKTQLEHEGIH